MDQARHQAQHRSILISITHCGWRKEMVNSNDLLGETSNDQTSDRLFHIVTPKRVQRY